MATGQYLSELALALVERGHEVTVVTSRRAYDHPETQFPKEENWRGVHIYRVASTGFGKSAKWRRAADFGSFLFCCCARLARLPRHDVIVALTSPPLISFIGAWLAKLRGSRFFYWVMDFNPDEAIAAGWLRPGSLIARSLESMSRFSLKRAVKIIALDRFMRDRIAAKGIGSEKIVIIPPWSHDSDVRFDPEGRQKFRHANGLDGKFVVMYSGNHSPCHPLDTLLAAAQELTSDPNVVFCFVGGGSEFRKIQQMTGDNGEESRSLHASRITQHVPNILCLPYQPLADLSASLSAADLHVVVMGNAFVGLVHPCKIYNILSVAAPVLYIGPSESHVTEILATQDLVPESARHERSNPHHRDYASARRGQAEWVVQEIRRLRKESTERRSPMHLQTLFSKDRLLPQIISELESL